MNHETRTPLNGIIGISDRLKSTDLNVKKQHYLGVIEDLGNTQMTVINDVLDCSKLKQKN